MCLGSCFEGTLAPASAVPKYKQHSRRNTLQTSLKDPKNPHVDGRRHSIAPPPPPPSERRRSSVSVPPKKGSGSSGNVPPR